MKPPCESPWTSLRVITVYNNFDTSLIWCYLKLPHNEHDPGHLNICKDRKVPNRRFPICVEELGSGSHSLCQSEM